MAPKKTTGASRKASSSKRSSGRTTRPTTKAPASAKADRTLNARNAAAAKRAPRNKGKEPEVIHDSGSPSDSGSVQGEGSPEPPSGWQEQMNTMQKQWQEFLAVRSRNNSPNLVGTPLVAGFGSQPSPQYGNSFGSGHLYPPQDPHHHQHLPTNNLPYTQGPDPGLQPPQRAFLHHRGKLPPITPLNSRFPALHPS